MSLIDALGSERRDALRQLAAKVGASDDTAVMAWAAFQSLASLPNEERHQAVVLLIGLEEIRRLANGEPPMFKVEERLRAVRVR